MTIINGINPRSKEDTFARNKVYFTEDYKLCGNKNIQINQTNESLLNFYLIILLDCLCIINSAAE